MSTHPIQSCVLFMPRSKGREGTYSFHTRFGWADCDDVQNALLHANKVAHVPAEKMRYLGVGDHAWAALEAFKAFVVPYFVNDKVRCCSHCGLPGHNRRTCELPEAPELIDPREEAA